MDYKYTNITNNLITTDNNQKIPNFIGIHYCTIAFHDEDGRLHRLNGPAVLIICINYENGGQEWWRHGELHREDGPAIIIPDNYSKQRWYLNHKRYYDLLDYLKDLNKIRPLTSEEIKHIEAQWKKT